MRTWGVTDDSWWSRIWPRSRVQPVQSSPENSKSVFAPKFHNCTMYQCFQNASRASQYAAIHKMSVNYTICSATQDATKATQFSGSRHFQICIPAPSSSCLFLPTTAHLALVMRSYIPSNKYQLACVEWVLLFLYRQFEVSSDISMLIVAEPSIRASRISSFEGALFSWGQGLIIHFGTSRSLFEISWIWRTVGSKALEEVFCVSFNNN